MRQKAKHSVAEIIEDIWAHIIEPNSSFNRYQLRHLYAIKSCRTPALGGELYMCNKCGQCHKRYYSCRNRNCPTCQRTQSLQWKDARLNEVLPVQYFHTVFTVPEVLNELFLAYPRIMYKILFDASWFTIDTLGWDHKYLGAQTGGISVLHTWGQNLSLHPHIHCIVPSGGIDHRNRWRVAKGKGKFLFPAKVMSTIFRARYVKLLKEWMELEGMEYSEQLHTELYKKDWVVYCKPPFGGAKGGIEYIAQYVFKTAITNHRIETVKADKVTFRYKDYRDASKVKRMILSKQEFVRRLSLHILPKSFIRIRHYGILSGRLKHKLLNLPTPKPKQDYVQFWADKGLDVLKCLNCKKGRMVFLSEIPKRGPPIKSKVKNHL